MTGPHDERIDAYCDGQLSDAERAAFEQAMDEDALLRATVERQRSIDEAIARIYAPPPADNRLGKAGLSLDAADAPPFSPLRQSSARRFAIAAAVAIGAVGGWLVVDQFRVPEINLAVETSVEDVYRYEVATGLEPNWKCENDQEFATAFSKRLKQPMLLAALPPGIESTGLDYAYTVSPATMHLLSRVDGEPVLVFVSRLEHAKEPTLSARSKLHLFRREVGELVLHELTPLDKPRLLGLFKQIEMPEEWK